jgi:hypothetical protein
MVKVIVGLNDDCKTFFAHRDLITSRSRFFAKALRTYDEDGEGNILWAEGEDGVVKLPKDDKHVFADYLHLLYQEMVPVRAKVRDINTTSLNELYFAADDAVEEEFTALSKLVFCEKLQDTQGKALVIAAFVQAVQLQRENGFRRYPDRGPVNIIFEGTMEGDALRKFCVDVYVLLGQASWFTDLEAQDYHREFTFDVMVEMARTRKRPVDKSKIKKLDAYYEMLQVAESKDTGKRLRTLGPTTTLPLADSNGWERTHLTHG